MTRQHCAGNSTKDHYCEYRAGLRHCKKERCVACDLLPRESIYAGDGLIVGLGRLAGVLGRFPDAVGCGPPRLAFTESEDHCAVGVLLSEAIDMALSILLLLFPFWG